MKSVELDRLKWTCLVKAIKPAQLCCKKNIATFASLQKWVSFNHGLELLRKQNLESKLCFSMNCGFPVLTYKNKRKVFTVKVVVWQKFNAQSWHRPWAAFVHTSWPWAKCFPILLSHLLNKYVIMNVKLMKKYRYNQTLIIFCLNTYLL